MMPYQAVAVIALSVLIIGLLLGMYLGNRIAQERVNEKIEMAERILQNAVDSIEAEVARRVCGEEKGCGGLMSDYKGIANMPGPGGSLGMCAVCGKDFMFEILMGKNVQVMGLEGMDKDFCVHGDCKKELGKAIKSKDWRDIPEGPLRKAFEDKFGKSESVDIEAAQPKRAAEV